MVIKIVRQWFDNNITNNENNISVLYFIIDSIDDADVEQKRYDWIYW